VTANATELEEPTESEGGSWHTTFGHPNEAHELTHRIAALDSGPC
jgi:hypothetical protein